MNCKEAREQIDLLVLGGLEEPALGRVRTHLDECASCREEEQKLQDLAFDLTHAVKTDAGDASPEFSRMWTAVEQTIRSERKAHRVRMGLFYAIRVAAVVIALVGGVWLFLRGELARSRNHAVVDWRYRDVSGAPSALSGYPILRDNWIFAVQGEPGSMKVVAIDKFNGKSIWQMSLHTIGALNADDRRVFVLGLDAQGRRGVWALDEMSGNIIWHQEQPSGTGIMDGPSSLALAGDGVCVASGPSLSLLRRDSGESSWTRHMGTSEATSICGTTDGRIYAASGRMLSALAATTGEVLWKQPLEGGGLAFVRPFVWADADHVLVARRRALKDGEVSCFDAKTGDRRWAEDTGSPLSAQVADGRIYVKSTLLEVIDLAKGKHVWSVPMDGCSPVATSEGHIYLIGGKEKQDFVSLDSATGRRLWEQRLAGSCSGVIVDGNRGYLRAHDGVLYAITIRNRT